MIVDSSMVEFTLDSDSNDRRERERFFPITKLFGAVNTTIYDQPVTYCVGLNKNGIFAVTFDKVNLTAGVQAELTGNLSRSHTADLTILANEVGPIAVMPVVADLAAMRVEKGHVFFRVAPPLHDEIEDPGMFIEKERDVSLTVDDFLSLWAGDEVTPLVFFDHAKGEDYIATIVPEKGSQNALLIFFEQSGAIERRVGNGVGSLTVFKQCLTGSLHSDLKGPPGLIEGLITDLSGRNEARKREYQTLLDQVVKRRDFPKIEEIQESQLPKLNEAGPVTNIDAVRESSQLVLMNLQHRPKNLGENGRVTSAEIFERETGIRDPELMQIVIQLRALAQYHEKVKRLGVGRKKGDIARAVVQSDLLSPQAIGRLFTHTSFAQNRDLQVPLLTEPVAERLELMAAEAGKGEKVVTKEGITLEIVQPSFRDNSEIVGFDGGMWVARAKSNRAPFLQTGDQLMVLDRGRQMVLATLPEGMQVTHIKTLQPESANSEVFIWATDKDGIEREYIYNRKTIEPFQLKVKGKPAKVRGIVSEPDKNGIKYYTLVYATNQGILSTGSTGEDCVLASAKGKSIARMTLKKQVLRWRNEILPEEQKSGKDHNLLHKVQPGRYRLNGCSDSKSIFLDGDKFKFVDFTQQGRGGIDSYLIRDLQLIGNYDENKGHIYLSSYRYIPGKKSHRFSITRKFGDITGLKEYSFSLLLDRAPKFSYNAKTNNVFVLQTQDVFSDIFGFSLFIYDLKRMKRLVGDEDFNLASWVQRVQPNGYIDVGVLDSQRQIIKKHMGVDLTLEDLNPIVAVIKPDMETVELLSKLQLTPDQSMKVVGMEPNENGVLIYFSNGAVLSIK